MVVLSDQTLGDTGCTIGSKGPHFVNRCYLQYDYEFDLCELAAEKKHKPKTLLNDFIACTQNVTSS